MCLILFAWQTDEKFPFVVAANRDEFFARSTRQAGFWPDASGVLAGRDLDAGGTWMGTTISGRFAALTNYRDMSNIKQNAPSRGQLVANFLTGQTHPEQYLQEISGDAAHYNGYNLLVGDGNSLCWASNVSKEAQRLEPGLYGVSNHLLNSPWPKVRDGKQALAESLDRLPDNTPLFSLLTNHEIHRDEDLPDTGVGKEWERLLSPAFIRSSAYGTRSSTTIVVRSDGLVSFDEQTWLQGGQRGPRARFHFKTLHTSTV